MTKTMILFGSLLAIAAHSGCKERLFNFSKDSQTELSSTPTPSPDSRSGQIAIGPQASSDSRGQVQSTPVSRTPTAYTPLKDASSKTLKLGQTLQYSVNGQAVDVTFVSILEDSRCPKNVVCIWEGQAKLQFKVGIPSMNLTKIVEPVLRAGHPQLAQVTVAAVGLDLVGLNPDTATTQPSTAQRPSPEATLIVGKAP
jgi:hypothetical protein